MASVDSIGLSVSSSSDLKHTNEINTYVTQREQILKSSASLLKSIAFGNTEKEDNIAKLTDILQGYEQKNELLKAELEALDHVPAELSTLRREYMDVYKETVQIKQFVTRKSFKNQKLQKVLLSHSQDSSPKKKTSHAGITFEDDERQLFKRLDVVQINAGTPQKLVEWIAESKTEDRMNYYTIFCLTYRYFMTSEELLAKLVDLYKSYDGDEEKPKRMSIVNFLGHWIRYHFVHDFEKKPEFCEEAKDFITIIENQDGGAVAKTVLKGMDKLSFDTKKTKNKRASVKAQKLLGQSTQESRRLQFTESPPESFVLKGPIDSFLDISPIEIARQITLRDHDLFSAIEPKECLKCVWSGRQQTELAPNILAMIAQFNGNSNRVVTSVVSEKNLKIRSNLMAHWITVVEELYNLNNFNGMITIIASLSTSSIFRLKKSWQKISQSRLETYQKLCTIISTDSASAKYRSHLHQCNPPLVPHLGLYLQDLTFIEDGNPIKLDNGFVNFIKCRMIGAQIQEMIQYQRVPYNINVVPEIAEFVLNSPTSTEDQQFEMSLQREPRRKPKKS